MVTQDPGLTADYWKVPRRARETFISCVGIKDHCRKPLSLSDIHWHNRSDESDAWAFFNWIFGPSFLL